MTMQFLDGYKSLIGVGLGVLVAVLGFFGLVSEAQVAIGETIAIAIFGVGVAGKLEKGKTATNDLLAALKDKAVILLASTAMLGALFGSAPAMAADCDFNDGVDAKIVRFAWPPAIGVNGVGFVDTEVGITGFKTACGNASFDLVGGFCLIPKVGGMLGPLCAKGED